MTQSVLQDRRALLLAVQTPDTPEHDVLDSLRELTDLCTSLDCVVADQVVQARDRIHPRTFFGPGKLEEVRQRLLEQQADLVVFDHNLSPSQGEHLEQELQVLVVDRTQVILEIFGHNARTAEARHQVQLAHLEYMLPRLVGMWAHLDRERGGIAGSKGAGEKQIDMDRSLIRHRIAKLKKELAHVTRERHTQRKRRNHCLQVSLVGYTNAGKSTLMNCLTDAAVRVEDRLFATLDTTTRVFPHEIRPQILLSDTVGFIKHLPHQLVASFRSTLEAVREADLLLHVVDVSHEAFAEHIATTKAVLEEIGAEAVPRLLVLNKADLLDNKAARLLVRRTYADAVFASASTGDVETLRHRIEAFFDKRMVTTPLVLQYAACGQLDKIYRWSRVNEVRYEQDGIHLIVTSTPANLERIRARVHNGNHPRAGSA